MPQQDPPRELHSQRHSLWRIPRQGVMALDYSRGQQTSRYRWEHSCVPPRHTDIAQNRGAPKRVTGIPPTDDSDHTAGETED